MKLPERISVIIEEFIQFPDTLAIAVAGSRSGENEDQFSDFDIYVYILNEISINERKKIANKYSSGRIEIDNRFWGPGDEWIDKALNTKIDIMYWNKTWMEDQISKVTDKYQAQTGYTTCFWHTLMCSTGLYDPQGWFDKLQKRADIAYPLELTKNILLNNYPILRYNYSSYYHQIELAIIRKDINSIQHRITEMLASYFDIVFAVNKVLHPGEKRLLDQVNKLCHHIPLRFEQDINGLLHALPDKGEQILRIISRLYDELDKIIIKSGFGRIIEPYLIKK